MDRSKSINIFFPKERVTIEVKVDHEDAMIFRLLEQPLLVERPGIFDLIELRNRSADVFEFVRVIKESGWKTCHWLLTEEQARSGAIDPILKQVERLGGKWARELGGLLSVSLPPGSDFGEIKAVGSL